MSRTAASRAGSGPSATPRCGRVPGLAVRSHGCVCVRAGRAATWCGARLYAMSLFSLSLSLSLCACVRACVFMRREGRNVVRGLRAHRELHVLHSCGDAPGAARVVDGVYVGARLADAAGACAAPSARARSWGTDVLRRKEVRVAVDDGQEHVAVRVAGEGPAPGTVSRGAALPGAPQSGRTAGWTWPIRAASALLVQHRRWTTGSRCWP